MGIFLIVCSLISISIPAQTKSNPESDSIVINPSFQHILKDTLKFEIPSGGHHFQTLSPQIKLTDQDQKLALIQRNGKILQNQNFRMPVYNPRFKSNMPVMKPDSTVHYHLLVKKIGKY